jgi:hypothetical protein
MESGRLGHDPGLNARVSENCNPLLLTPSFDLDKTTENKMLDR